MSDDLQSEVSLSKRLERALQDYPGFPRSGIVFKDLCPVLADAILFRDVTHALALFARETKAEAIIGIESRGFLFGAPVALELGLPFIPARKKGKLPGELVRAEYALEYGRDVIEIQKAAIHPGRTHLILDDVLATGGTAKAVAECVLKAQGQISGFGFVLDIPPLGGAVQLSQFQKDAPIRSLVSV